MIKYLDAPTLGQLANTRGLHIGRVLFRLHYEYCRPMDSMGKCTYQCTDCQVSLTRIFRPFVNAKDKEALLTWRARDALAAQQESEHEGQPVTDRFGQPKFENVFAYLEEAL